MRVVFINPMSQLGGAEFILLDLMASLPAALPGLEQHLILAASDGPLAERAEACGVTVHRLPLPEVIASLGDSALRDRGKVRAAVDLSRHALPTMFEVRRYTTALRSRLLDLQPDLIHSNGIKAHILLARAAPRGVPVVWHVHDFYGPRILMSKVLRRISGKAAHAIAISEAVSRDAETVLPGVPVTVVYNAIDTEFFSPGPGDGPWLDRLAGVPEAPDGTVRVGLVATYARWKGQDLFLRALSCLPRDLKMRAYIVGGPIYKTRGSQFQRDELQAMARDLGVEDRVAFVPLQSNTADVYRSLDVVVHASTQPEPFGRTIAEAMACGRATIVSRAGGAVELFNEDVDAIGVPPVDPNELAHAIVGLVGDPERRQRLGTMGRQTAIARYARDRMGREVAEIYRSVLRGREPR